jgi:hypothetical protein
LCLGVAACGGGLPADSVPRPIGEDLVALLPSGAEMVIDVDLVQLRTWDEIERVLGLLPAAGRARLERLGPRWMNEIDALALGAFSVEKARASVVILRGDLDDQHLPALLDGEVKKRDLNGRTLYFSGGEAALRIGRRLIANGDEIEVLRVAEVLGGDLQNVRDGRADAPLRAALARAPTGKAGRPAVIGAVTGGPLLEDRLVAAGIAGGTPRSASFAVAVGDGIDAVMVLGMDTEIEAAKLRDDFDHAVRDLRASSFVRLLGIGSALEMVVVAREKDVRIAYRVSGDRLARALDRFDSARKALSAAPVAPPAAAKP